ncbi:MAG: hypothetical protein M9894_18930 [Planctomycetes bacterium]|nr:hypothetical protein [Planctomycetota bacterium]
MRSTTRALGAMLAAAVALGGAAVADERDTMVDWAGFEALVAVTGEEYVRGRDALLASDDGPALAARLRPLTGAADARRAVTARALLGWVERRALHEDVLARLDAVDIEVESRKATGLPGVWARFADLARTEWGPPVLPLAWEGLLKRTDWPMWRLGACLHMIGALPDAASAPVLIEFIERTEDEGLRRLAGQVLGRMPKEARDPVERARKRTAGIADALGRAGEALEGGR